MKIDYCFNMEEWFKGFWGIQNTRYEDEEAN